MSGIPRSYVTTDGATTMKPMRTRMSLLFVLALILPQAACAYGAGRGALIGGGAGGAIGALLGKAKGDAGKGAVLGAAVGATVGAVIGSELDRQAGEITARVEHAQVERRGEETNLTFDGGILFGFDSSELTPDARRSIDALARILIDYPGYQVRVAGHTDSVGTDAYNQALSERRAEAVSSRLMTSGVRPSRITSRGLGESQPVATKEPLHKSAPHAS